MEKTLLTSPVFLRPASAAIESLEETPVVALPKVPHIGVPHFRFREPSNFQPSTRNVFSPRSLPLRVLNDPHLGEHQPRK